MSKTKSTQPKPAAKTAPIRPNLNAEKSETASTNTPFWHYLLVFLLPMAVYLRTTGFEFSYHDDDHMIIERAEEMKKGVDVGLAFGTDAWLSVKEIELFRPWQTMTYALDYGLGGGDAGPFHAHNVLIFSLGALLFFLLLRRIFPESPRTALWGALLYSLNFLFAHAVSWIPARGDLWLFVFSNLCLISFFDYLKKGSAGFLFGSAFFFLMALFLQKNRQRLCWAFWRSWAIFMVQKRVFRAFFGRPSRSWARAWLGG